MQERYPKSLFFLFLIAPRQRPVSAAFAVLAPFLEVGSEKIGVSRKLLSSKLRWNPILKSFNWKLKRMKGSGGGGCPKIRTTQTGGRKGSQAKWYAGHVARMLSEGQRGSVMCSCSFWELPVPAFSKIQGCLWVTRGYSLTPDSYHELEVETGPAYWNHEKKGNSTDLSLTPQSLFPTIVNSPGSADKTFLRFW